MQQPVALIKKVQQLVGQIPCGHNVLVVSKVKSLEEAEFYLEELAAPLRGVFNFIRVWLIPVDYSQEVYQGVTIRMICTVLDDITKIPLIV